MKGQRVWTFGSFEFCEEKLQLLRDGIEVKVEGMKPRLVLRYLLLHAQRAVPQQELLQKVWIDHGSRVELGSVSVAINALRDAFGEPDRNGILRTVPNIGIEWAVPVQAVREEVRARFAKDDPVPGSPGWQMELLLSVDKHREVWQTTRLGTSRRRVVKVAWNEAGLELLRAERDAFDALREVCGDAIPAELSEEPDSRQEGLEEIPEASLGRLFSRGYKAQLEQAPYVLETESLGRGLKEWATREGGLASLPESVRVGIVAGVASAVAKLHSAGWCHGALGPDCVWVERRGREWLVRLDSFGTYRPEAPLEGGDGLCARRLEAAGKRPEADQIYIAPELKSGYETGMATSKGDLYALGVLLYQCMVCRWEAPLVGWGQAVSDRVLRADIEEAAHRDPDRRSRNAEQFAQDLMSLAQRREREEQAEKIQEQKLESDRKLAGELAKKPLRRALAYAMAAVALVSALVATLEIRSLRRERDAAEARQRQEQAQRQEEQAVEAFLERMLFDGDAWMRGPMTGEQLAERGLRMSQALEKTPRMHATVLNLLGNGLGDLGENEKAESVLAQALKEWQKIDEGGRGEAKTLRSLASVKDSESEPAEALKLANQALAMETNTVPADDMEIARTRTQIAEDLISLHQNQQALGILEDVVAWEKERPELQADLSTALTDLGNAENMLNNYQASLDYQEQAMRIDQAASGNDHPDYAEHLLTISNDHMQLGEYASAVSEAKQAVGILQEWLPPGHHDIAAAKEMEATSLLRLPGKTREAEQLFREALETLSREGHRSVSEANTLTGLGIVERMESRCGEAVADGNRAIAIYRQLYPRPNVFWGAGYSALAETYADCDDWARAAPAAEEAFRDDARELRPDDRRWLRLETTLARVRVKQGRIAEARTLVESVLGHTPQGDPRTEEIRNRAQDVWKVVGGSVVLPTSRLQ